MRWLTFSVLAAGVWVGQTTLAPRLSIGGVQPDWVLVLVVFFGLYGPERDGCVAGWVLGLGADLMSVERLGMMSLAYCLTAVAVRSVRELVFLKRPATHFVVTLCAGLILWCGVLAYRVVVYPGSVSGWSGAAAEGLAGALYSAGWAVGIHAVLLRFSRSLGLHTSRYTHRAMSAAGGAGV